MIASGLQEGLNACTNACKMFICRLSGLQLGFVIVGASMGALGIMILFVGCLATGATRHKVYRTWRGRVGGRISCAVVSGNWALFLKILNLSRFFEVFC